MNIGIDIRSLMVKERTGVGEYTYALLDALFEIDENNQYFLFYNSWKDVSGVIPKWKQDNVHFISTKIPNKLLNLSLFLFGRPRLDRFISKHLNIKTLKHLDFFFSPNIHFTALSEKTKHILTIHDLSFEHFRECYSWKRRLWHNIINPRRQCERADIILTPSESTRLDVVETYGIDREKVKVLNPGLNLDFRYQISDIKNLIKEKYNLPDKFILFLGTVEPRKNIIGLIESYRKSSLRVDGCSLIIAGAKGWKSAPIMKAIEETEGVRYIGYVDAKDKSALYELADLFVYPSLYEGFGFPILEAMASGTPVIASNRSSLPEVGGDAVHYVNPMNIVELTGAMEKLLKSENPRNMYIERGLEQSKKFQWNVTAENFLSLISS